MAEPSTGQAEGSVHLTVVFGRVKSYISTQFSSPTIIYHPTTLSSPASLVKGMFLTGSVHEPGLQNSVNAAGET